MDQNTFSAADQHVDKISEEFEHLLSPEACKSLRDELVAFSREIADHDVVEFQADDIADPTAREEHQMEDRR